MPIILARNIGSSHRSPTPQRHIQLLGLERDFSGLDVGLDVNQVDLSAPRLFLLLSTIRDLFLGSFGDLLLKDDKSSPDIRGPPD